MFEVTSAIAHEGRNGVPPLYGFLFPGRDSGLFGMFYELLAAAGGNLFDDTLQPTFDSPAGRWAIEQIVGLYQRHEATPRELPDWHYDEISASFRAGHAAAVSDWPGSYHLYRSPATCAVPDQIELALLPTGPAGTRAAYSGCHSFAIPRRAAQPEVSAALLAHLTSFDAQLGEARRGAIPCRASALAAVGAEAAAHPAEARRWQLLAETEPTDDHPAPVRGVSALRGCAVAQRAAGDEGRALGRRRAAPRRVRRAGHRRRARRREVGVSV